MTKQLVDVFVGSPVEDRGELRLLGRLRSDLERGGVEARIFANFIAGKDQRQVDLLVATSARLAHVEVKSVDVNVPLLADANGPWRQLLPNGRERSLDRNYYRQAHDTTYAISDAMHAVARTGAVPSTPGKFFRDIDTLICLNPHVPPGSRLAPYKHVHVVSYDDLVSRLTEPGPQPNWLWRHWDEFARHLGLYIEPTDTPAQRQRQAKLQELADYQRRFIELHQAGLHELVQVTARVGGQDASTSFQAMMAVGRNQGLAVATGTSGAGKTHTALHAAVELAREGVTPIWVRCRDYEPGRFAVAMARATAPFTTEPTTALVRYAADAGSPVVVFLDGLNECPAGSRGELIEQLLALRLRQPVAAVITSSEPVVVPDSVAVTRIEHVLPDVEEREALLRSYGAPHLPVADTLITPFELALAAECAGDLTPDASRTTVLDAYIHRRCPTEAVRSVLRLLAALMDDRLRLSLPMTEALVELRSAPAVTPEIVDGVLASPLLAVGQGRVAFAHERLGRFLAAEHLVLSMRDTDGLAAVLREPNRKDLREHAVALHADGDRRTGLLVALADAERLADAARGDLGPLTADAIRRRIVQALEEAERETAAASFELSVEDSTFGRWTLPQPRTELDHALLTAAGLCVSDALFIPEVAALLDATDARSARAMRDLRDGGHRLAITALVQSTYSGMIMSSTDVLRELGGSVVARTLGHDRMFRRQPRTDAPTATSMLTATSHAPRWGRLYAALLLVNDRNETDLRGLPELLGDAWNANGYHLRLEALTRVTFCARDVDTDTAKRILDVLRTLDPGDSWGLSSTLVEALAAYDDIQPIATLDDIRADIAAVLAAPDDPLAAQAAERLIGLQFDNTAVLGPYDEAIGELSSDERLRLCVLALRDSHSPFHVDWIVTEISRLADGTNDLATEVLRRQLTHVDTDTPMIHEPVAAHLAALRWWALTHAALPAAPTAAGDPMQHAWRLLDRLLFAELRAAPLEPAQTEQIWVELLDLFPAQATAALQHLRSADMWWRGPDASALELLTRAHPEKLRRLLEWALTHRDAFPPPSVTQMHNDMRTVIDILGRVGTTETLTVLRQHLTDPQLGDAAVSASHDIQRRLDPGL